MTTLKLSTRGVHLIIGAEIGAQYPGDQRYYNLKVAKFTVPSNGSGVTIGFGYDCGMNSREQILRDWQGYVSNEILSFLVSCAGRTGAAAKAKLTPAAKLYRIPYEVALEVFSTITLPRYCKTALAAYPGLDKLNEDTQAVIVSIVFNRGSRLRDTAGKETLEKAREEMRELGPAILAGDYNALADEIESMKRLWDGLPDFPGDVEEKLDGLIIRRMQEAALVRSSVTAIPDTNIISVLC